MAQPTKQTRATESVLRELEMVRMQGRYNILDRHGVQSAAADLDLDELVCFIADQLEDGGSWMKTLTALGEWSNNLSAAKRAEIAGDLAELTGEPDGDREIDEDEDEALAAAEAAASEYEDL